MRQARFRAALASATVAAAMGCSPADLTPLLTAAEPFKKATTPRPGGSQVVGVTPSPTPTSGTPPSPLPAPEPSNSRGSGTSPQPTPTSDPTNLPTAQPTAQLTAQPTLAPDELSLLSLNVKGSHYVRLEWNTVDAGTAAIERESGGFVATMSATGSAFVDIGAPTNRLIYRVAVAGKTYRGSISPMTHADCGSSGPAPGGGTGPSGGPPECVWRASGSGVNPFKYYMQGQPIPTVQAPATLAWTDVADRAGYRVEFGVVSLPQAPPPAFGAEVVAYTSARSIVAGQNPGIPGFTDSEGFKALLSASGQAERQWQTATGGNLYGWRMSPVVRSADGRSYAIGEAALFPRIFKSQ